MPLLPNAPLAEVIFELRWALEGEAEVPATLREDPGYLVMASGFASAAKKSSLAYQRRRQVGPIINSYIVDRSYHRSADFGMPTWQIGPGVLACNESTQYEWTSFKEFCLSGVDALISTYPRMEPFPFRPSQLELLYIDSINPRLADAVPFLEFINRYTELNLGLPELASIGLDAVRSIGDINFTIPIVGQKDSTANIRLGIGKIADVDTIILQTRVVTASPKINQPGRKTNLLGYVNRWLEGAHRITSPLFRAIIKADLMKKFTVATNA